MLQHILFCDGWKSWTFLNRAVPDRPKAGAFPWTDHSINRTRAAAPRVRALNEYHHRCAGTR